MDNVQIIILSEPEANIRTERNTIHSHIQQKVCNGYKHFFNHAHLPNINEFPLLISHKL